LVAQGLPIEVLFAADAQYLRHTAVAMSSLLRSNPERFQRLWLATFEPDSAEVWALRDFLLEAYGVSLSVLGVGSEQFSGLFTSGHISREAYLRFCVADYLPETIRAVLYLDSDVLVLRRIGGLDNIVNSQKFAEVPLMAVPTETGSHLRRLGFKSNHYFNSGVLLINLEIWRQGRLSERLMNRARSLGKSVTMHDQDVLNLEFEGNWAILPREYNETRLTSRSNRARIVHFVGVLKPWMYGNRHPYRSEYWALDRLSPFRVAHPIGLGTYLTKKLIPRRLRRMPKALGIRGRKAYRMFRRGIEFR